MVFGIIRFTDRDVLFYCIIEVVNMTFVGCRILVDSRSVDQDYFLGEHVVMRIQILREAERHVKNQHMCQKMPIPCTDAIWRAEDLANEQKTSEKRHRFPRSNHPASTMSTSNRLRAIKLYKEVRDTSCVQTIAYTCAASASSDRA